MKAAKKTDKAVPAASAVPQGPSSYNCCVEDVWYIVVLQNGTFIFKDGSKYGLFQLFGKWLMKFRGRVQGSQ